MKEERIRWLWEKYLPLGKLVILDGPPGTGKSTLTLDLASRLTTGRPMPDGTAAGVGPSGVVLLTVEDGISDTVLPRLRAAGADTGRVIARQTVYGSEGDRMPDIADLAHLEDDIAAVDARLVIVDPLVAFIGEDRNIYNDQQVRIALGPLSKLADETGTTFLLVRHLTKQQNGNAINAGGGSIGIIGAVRMGLLCIPDRTDASGQRKVLGVSKSNLGKLPPSLSFHIEEVEDVGRIAWDGRSEVSLEELLREPERTRMKAEDAGIEFLREVLADGQVAARKVFAEAGRAGISKSTLERCKRELGVRSIRRGGVAGEGEWIWVLGD